MNIRLRIEEMEKRQLSQYAALSSASRGREVCEELCPVRTDFQRDRDRIIHSKGFRRLKQKTQVFISPTGDHYRTRLTHTLEVAQIARTIAKALRLNEDLTEAIALGHDLGHTPFGHAGEEALDEALGEFGLSFKHNEQSLRVVEVLEPMNLTCEVRDGILNHTGKKDPVTLEGRIVKIADRIAYINHDIDDALRSGIIKEEDLPAECIAVLGTRHSERINTMVTDMISSSWEISEIRMSPEVWEAMDRLRDYLFSMVYIGSDAKTEELKAKKVLQKLFAYYVENSESLPRYLQEYLQEKHTENACARISCDYVAGMTDGYALYTYKKLFLPNPWLD
ncbi:deoxyguanosinetriphosphate triphosphohydrolase [Phosphitispora sp. TUW77]|uniref:deoxyguanosinetriphosphate triphosphohydrolase n=1 Tax=Phosphitispora sp. TUW77 TaxID=3152361 RepID=UPI003AB4095C